VIKTNTEMREREGWLSTGRSDSSKKQWKEDESQLMFHILAGISDPMATSLSIKISWCTFIQQHKHYTKEAPQSRVITLRLPYFLYWLISTWTAIIQQWTLVNNNFSHNQAVCEKCKTLCSTVQYLATWAT